VEGQRLEPLLAWVGVMAGDTRQRGKQQAVTVNGMYGTSFWRPMLSACEALLHPSTLSADMP
jgi:hypothetical protein